MALHARGLRAVTAGDGQIVIKLGRRELLVRGDGAQTVVAHLLAELDGTRELVDVVAALDEEHRETAIRVVQALVARQMIGDEAEDAPQPEAPAARFYASFGPTGEDAQQALADARVVVYGSGVLARSLVEGLGELAVGSVTVVDDPALANPLEPALLDGDGPGRSTVVALGDADLARADVLVAASDLGQEHALAAVGRVALAERILFLPLWLSEMVGYVGPLTYPFQTACLTCYQLRIDSNARNVEARRAVRRLVDEDPVGTTSGYLPPMARVVGNVAAMEVAKALGGFVPIDVVGRSVEVNLVSLRTSVRRVLKLPRCPDCGEVARRATPTVLAGIQIGN